METMIAYCGLHCSKCATYIATMEDDNEKRKQVAQEWSKLFGIDLKPEDMHCDGCKSAGGRLFGHCNVCDIRKCGMGKNIENCAHCTDYACDKLTPILTMMPVAGKSLEKIRKQLSG